MVVVRLGVSMLVRRWWCWGCVTKVMVVLVGFFPGGDHAGGGSIVVMVLM